MRIRLIALQPNAKRIMQSNKLERAGENEPLRHLAVYNLSGQAKCHFSYENCCNLMTLCHRPSDILDEDSPQPAADFVLRLVFPDDV